MNEDTKYSSFDLMKIFGIKRGSWFNLKNKLQLDNYAETIIEGNQKKFVYTQEAYNVLKENYNKKAVKEIKENPKMLILINENGQLKANIKKYEELSNKFEKLYKETSEENKQLYKRNGSLLKENVDKDKQLYEKDLQLEELKKENEKLKHRNLIKRIFNL